MKELATSSLRRLSDGTPFYGLVGVLARDEDEDLVQCHLCGRWLRAIGNSHLRRGHGWTLDAYRDAFKLPRGTPTCAKSLSRGQSIRASAQVKSQRLGLVPGERLRHGAPSLRPWQTLAARNPALASELYRERNPGLTADSVAAGSPKKVWWRCGSCGHAWQASVRSRHVGHGCPACFRARQRSSGPTPPSDGASLADTRPDLIPEWDDKRNSPHLPDTVRPGSHLKAWWHCQECGHRWQATVDNRARGHGCARCARARSAKERSRRPYEKSLQARFPQVAAQLREVQDEDINPVSLSAFSSKKVWWRCPHCQHEWRAQVSNRTAGQTRCPACFARQRGADGGPVT